MSSTRDLVVLGTALAIAGYEWDLYSQRGCPFRLNVYALTQTPLRPGREAQEIRIVWSGSSPSLATLAGELEAWMLAHAENQRGAL